MAVAELMYANPRKRRKTRRAKRKTIARRKSPSRLATTRTTTIKRYRRNPARRSGGALSVNNMVDTMKTGAVGAAGALAVDVAMAKLPIPDNFKSGALAPLTKGLVGIGIGLLVSKGLKNRALGKELANGAATVALYNTGRQMVGPTIGLDYYPGDGLMGNDLLGDDWGDDLGYFSASPVYSGVNDF